MSISKMKMAAIVAAGGIAIVAAVGLYITSNSVVENDGRGLVDYESIVNVAFDDVSDFLAAETDYDMVRIRRATMLTLSDGTAWLCSGDVVHSAVGVGCLGDHIVIKFDTTSTNSSLIGSPDGSYSLGAPVDVVIHRDAETRQWHFYNFVTQ